MNGKIFRAALLGGTCGLVLAGPAWAENFDIPGGDLKAALDAYVK